MTLFTTILIVCGKVNFTNLSRYSDLSEKTYRRQFEKEFDFFNLNLSVIATATEPEQTVLGVMDVYFHHQTDDYCFHQSDWFSLLGVALRCGWQPQGLRHLFDPTVPRILPSDEFQKMLDEFIGIITDDDVDIVEEYSPSLYPCRGEFISNTI